MTGQAPDWLLYEVSELTRRVRGYSEAEAVFKRELIRLREELHAETERANNAEDERNDARQELRDRVAEVADLVSRLDVEANTANRMATRVVRAEAIIARIEVGGDYVYDARKAVSK